MTSDNSGRRRGDRFRGSRAQQPDDHEQAQPEEDPPWLADIVGMRLISQALEEDERVNGPRFATNLSGAGPPSLPIPFHFAARTNSATFNTPSNSYNITPSSGLAAALASTPTQKGISAHSFTRGGDDGGRVQQAVTRAMATWENYIARDTQAPASVLLGVNPPKEAANDEMKPTEETSNMPKSTNGGHGGRAKGGRRRRKGKK